MLLHIHEPTDEQQNDGFDTCDSWSSYQPTATNWPCVAAGGSVCWLLTGGRQYGTVTHNTIDKGYGDPSYHDAVLLIFCGSQKWLSLMFITTTVNFL